MDAPTPAPFTFAELTPTAFLDRSAHAFAPRPAIVDGDQRFTYAEFADRSKRLAGALHSLGVEPGDRVAALASNSHVMLEAHHGVPYAGAVLVPLNTRLSVNELVHIVGHSGARVLIATRELADQARQVADETGVELSPRATATTRWSSPARRASSPSPTSTACSRSTTRPGRPACPRA